jgi:hypothetical protein
VILLVVSYTLGQFAQYFLILLWIQWLRMRSARVTITARSETSAQPG